ncbi:hypothetical protein H0H87_001294 [Tephrocybe sp. NHM501043]|nr:hypothetical protein H0H87_001294 [Tephrocybe sp. NHM501043]
MVRLAGASTRNRNRQISNKFRLKVIQGDVVADPVEVAQEGGEENQYTNLVAGVDADDANEHHLQEVLHASSQNAQTNRSTRGAQSNGALAPHIPAFIPTPDSTGIVENYSDLYTSNRWRDPVTYLHTSVTPEESCNYALASNFTYYMDERDKEWLDKNNEVARGEGTSAQGALSASASNSLPRTSVRSSKAKGKGPDISFNLSISDDEFELVMGLFEKVTHEKTEYLHHSLETGMAFPAFSDYQDTFANSLFPATFVSFSVPHWIPAPSHLVRIARLVYPHWKERRTERGGHRIIPILNYDEADTLNESYVCFRRREAKTIRKTRASQSTSSDKLVRLQTELADPLELGKHLLQRELFKKGAALHMRQVWDKRILLADFKRWHPGWGDKTDEDLLIDKELPKRAELPRPPKVKSEMIAGTLISPEVVTILPSDRTVSINDAMEEIFNRQKDQDRTWEDQIDYISVKPVAPSPPERRIHRAIRTRIGRGGRLHVDRRNHITPSIVPGKRTPFPGADDAMAGAEDDELERMREIWRYDADDIPALGPGGLDESHRVLTAGSFNTPLITDRRQQFVVPYRIGVPLPRRLPTTRPGVPPGCKRSPSAMPNGTPISVQQQLKKMPPPTNVPQMRISSNGGMRPTSVATTMPSPALLLQSSPPSSATSEQHTPSSNGIHRAAINLPHIDPSRADAGGISTRFNAVSHLDIGRQQDSKVNSTILIPSQPPSMMIGATNGYHASTLQLPSAFANSSSAQLGLSDHGLSPLQMQNLKTAFANAQNHPDSKGPGRALSAYIPAGPANISLQQQLAASTSQNFNMKISSSRPLQWANGAPPPNKSPVSSPMDSQFSGSMSPPATQPVSVRVSSATGMPSGIRVASNGPLNTHMSPHAQTTVLPLSNTLVQTQSPSPIPLTPTLPRASPLLQNQQPAGSSKSGY